MIGLDVIVKLFDKIGKEIKIPCACGNQETIVIYNRSEYRWHCPICKEKNNRKK